MTGRPGVYPYLGLIRPNSLLIKRRRVFFSFHYERDNWSVSQIRNSWLANPTHAAQPFYDHAAWEAIKRKSDAAIRNWIDTQLTGSSVTVVLIGPETLNRRWVRYEIDETLRRKKGLLGITLEGIRQSNGQPDLWHQYAAYGPFSPPKPTHSVYNMPGWIELAFMQSGKQCL